MSTTNIPSSNKNSAIFIFHRDLRLFDNRALNAAILENEIVLPFFIFTPKQLEDSNKYKSKNALQFLHESILDLQHKIELLGGKLNCFFGNPRDILSEVINTLERKPSAVYFSRDYTPYSILRDQAIMEFLESQQIKCNIIHNVLLNEPEMVKTKQGNPYSIFTPYYKTARGILIPEPETPWNSARDQTVFCNLKLPQERSPDLLLNYYSPLETPRYRGGRDEGLKLLKTLLNLKNYETERDTPSLDKTSHLSPHLKFGTISIRETYHSTGIMLGYDHPLIRQLYWRDFFTQIGLFFPHVFQTSFRKKYEKLPWSKNQVNFQAWKKGETGFPIVDAGMRQLNTTGTMHNRVRMIVASFLVKDLHINWRWGEQYFAQRLVDYDPAVNNGNWQWAASTGCDAQPYFRIFNPWRQQSRFDPDCCYIKKWIPELKSSTTRQIQNLFKPTSEPIPGYPRPIVDHTKEAEKTKFIFKSFQI